MCSAFVPYRSVFPHNLNVVAGRYSGQSLSCVVHVQNKEYRNEVNHRGQKLMREHGLGLFLFLPRSLRHSLQPLSVLKRRRFLVSFEHVPLAKLRGFA